MTIPIKKQPSTKRCSTCGQQYSTRQKSEIANKIAKETLGTLSPYHNTCLDCIQSHLKDYRDAVKPDLINAVTDLKQAEQAYKKALYIKQTLANKHRDADTQQQFIKFFLQQAHDKALNTKPATKTKTTKTAKSRIKQADIISTLLSSLTPEQRALVAAKAKSL